MKRIIFALILLSSIHAYSQNCVEEIVCSEFTVAAIMENGDTYYWGDNEYGHYGDGTTENQTIMLQWNESIISVGLSQRHTSVIKEDGTIWSWGQNALGQLGDGTTDESLVPVQTGSDDDWMEISSGFYHSIALKEDGTLWGWGNNGAYEVSYTGEIHKEPILMSEETDWAKIYAGYFATFGIKEDGTLWGRGRNNRGNVGVGNLNLVLQLTQIGEDNDWKKIEARNYSRTFALKEDGTIWGWGENSTQNILNAEDEIVSSPKLINDETWIDIAAGSQYIMAIKNDGTLWYWGSYGYFENGMIIPEVSEFTQIGTDNDWEKVTSGKSSSFAIKEDGSLWTWGFNGRGTLGNNSTVSIAEPILLIDCVDLGMDSPNSTVINFYPNPTTDLIYWSAETDFNEYEILNLNGKTLKKAKKEKNYIDLSALPTGTYFIKFYTQNNKQTFQRIIKL